MLRGVETVIVDEVHAVAGTKRGAHLALSLERLERAHRPAVPADRALGHAAAAGGDRALRLRRPADRARRRRLAQGARPRGRRRARGHARARLRPGPQPAGAAARASRWTPATSRRPASIWPSIYPALLDLVRQHRSTIVFVNNRRLAERLALRLNELADETIARAHHGSLAREQRIEIEELLKAGLIPCLVATSSLELGIDMGAVDLVIQVESPKSVARGLQRVGRAGHDLGAVSKGRIFPKFRADLLESAVVAKAMREGADRGDADPAQPARRARAADRRDLRRGRDLGRRPARARARRVPVRRLSRGRSSRTCSTCSPAATRRTSSPSCGRGSSGTGPPASSRDAQGARRLAVTNAGTIPDRGLFGVFQVDGGGRVGELDEEMVYEARQGQTFMLGASTWRIEEITRDRVLVSPAPGVPGAVPVLEGRGRRPAVRAGREDRPRLARDRRALRREGARAARRRLPPRSARGEEPPHLPPRPGRGERRRRPVRPHDRGRALPRRDRRLAALHPDAVRRARARAVGDGARRAPARRARARGAVDLVGRRDRAAPARGGRAAADRRPAPHARRDRGARRPGGRAAPPCSAPASARTPPGRS